MTKTVKTLFTLSVILNVLLLGAGAGLAVKEYRDEPWHMAKADMSPEGQAMLEQNFEAMHKDMEPIFDQMKKAREDLRQVMMKEQFDSATFDQVTQRLRDLRQQMGDRMSAATKQIVVSLPIEDRRKMADRFPMGMGAKNASWHCDKDGKNAGANGPAAAAPPSDNKGESHY